MKSFEDSIPLPPSDAEEISTACDYCSIGCGYRVYRWPVGKMGGPKKNQNALNINFPAAGLSGNWISPAMHNIINHKGIQHHIIVLPDPHMSVVNIEGDHSIRGGALAQKLYNPNSLTHDRLHKPLLRINGELEPIEWDDAIEIFAQLSQYAIDKFGRSSWAQKRYSYQFFENTYALSKLAWQSIQSPAFAEHDNPGKFPSTPGLIDAGIDNFSACYEDYYESDVLFISGSDPYETKTILFNQWIKRGIEEKDNRVIMVNPRKTSGVAYVEEMDGLHLPIMPGTDTLLHLALIRIILENGWEDRDFINEYISTPLDQRKYKKSKRKVPWRWMNSYDDFKAENFDDYKTWILNSKESQLQFVIERTGLSAKQITATAELLAKPKEDGKRPKTSFFFEKGLYWSNNYLNTASLASLALICGAGNRPGQMISRMGGHQRGGMTTANFPRLEQPREFEGYHRQALDLDRWLESGKLRFTWVVGTTWIGSMTASTTLRDAIENQTINHKVQLTSKESVINQAKQRMDEGGMFLVDQDIYLTREIGKKYADLILPSATWGESDFVRANSERRLRVYSKISDPPGEAKPDWEIVALIGKKMGFSGYDWKYPHEVFAEAAQASRRTIFNFQNLADEAKRRLTNTHEVLRSFGSEGIQAPIQYRNGKLIGTKRLHDPNYIIYQNDKRLKTRFTKGMSQFKTTHGKANLIKSPWEYFEDFYETVKPRDEEVWVLNGRINEIWQTGFDDLLRRKQIRDRWPHNFLEIHPKDANKLGIESGDMVKVSSDRILVQSEEFAGDTLEDNRFKNLLKKGFIRTVSASVELVAIVSEVVRPGVTFTYFNFPGSTANNLVSRVPDPISGNYRFKLGVGRITKIRESKYKNDLSKMSFAPRYPI